MGAGGPGQVAGIEAQEMEGGRENAGKTWPHLLFPGSREGALVPAHCPVPLTAWSP